MKIAHCLSLLMLVAVVSTGCLADPNAGSADKPAEEKRENIIGKTTQDIGEFDAEKDGDAVDDMKVKEDAGYLGALSGGYGSAIGQISKLKIKTAMDMYHAMNDATYPKDHEEFMTKIIKANNIELPVLPGGRQYKYDVEKHELVIVKAAKE